MNPSTRLRPGGRSARVQEAVHAATRELIERHGRDALTVPQDAIVMRDGFAHVLKLGEGDRVQLLRVQTGRLADGRVEITQGLDANARVVVRGGAFLNDGDLVQVVADSVPKVPSTPASPAQAASK